MKDRFAKANQITIVGLFIMSLTIVTQCAFGQSKTENDNTIETNEPLSPDVTDQQDVNSQHLILKTGGVYSGRIEMSGGGYVVRRNNGSSVRFNLGEVDFVCGTLNDAFNQLLDRVSIGDVLGHQRLANWCLRNGMTSNARRQLETIQNVSRDSATTRMLQRQIESAERVAARQTEAALTANLETPTRNASHQTSAEGIKSSATQTGVQRLPKTELAMASTAELQKTIASFETDSIREFNTSVHNRIVNGCAAAQCHGNADATMRLWRVDNQGGIQSTGVRRNLHAITQFLDRTNPANSELLRYTRQVHGEMESPAYEETSFHYHAIKDWVMATGNLDVPARPMPAVEEKPENGISQTTFVDPARTMSPNTPSPVDLMTEQPRFAPRDEFDPQIFNRNYSSGPPSKKPQALSPREPNSTTQLRSLPVEDIAKEPTKKIPVEVPQKQKGTRPLPPVDEG